MVPTTIDDDGGTFDTPTTEITQNQATGFFFKFRQIYPIMKQILKECTIIFARFELKNNLLFYSALEVAHIPTIVLVVIYVKYLKFMARY